MIDKSFIEKIEDLVRDNLTVEIDGNVWSTKSLNPVNKIVFEPIVFRNLASLVDALSSGLIKPITGEKLAIICYWDEVRVVSEFVKQNGDYIVHAVVKREDEFEAFALNRDVEIKKFIISLMSEFADTPDRARLLKFLSRVDEETVVSVSDDGVTQSAVVKTSVSGAIRKQESFSPYVVLAPYRTFREVEQPESVFLFRLDKRDRGVFCSLFSADGGTWKIEAVNRVKSFISGLVDKAGLDIAVL